MRNQEVSRIETCADEAGARLQRNRRLKVRERTRCELVESLGEMAQTNSIRNRETARKLENSTGHFDVKSGSC